MITLLEIKKSINDKLINEFNYEVNSNDVKEGFKRPSFFVTFEEVKRSSTIEQVERSLMVLIYFFPSNKHEYSIEVMEVQEKLENVFDLKLQIKDRFFNITEVVSDVTDGVLNFSFYIVYCEGKEMEDTDLMKELLLN